MIILRSSSTQDSGTGTEGDPGLLPSMLFGNDCSDELPLYPGKTESLKVHHTSGLRTGYVSKDV